ncbi:Alpha/beta hydrolase family protein [Enhygromyxa salina]|uniref:Alpha/beta hydrolase family protein n=1 Tax=Enhygromyxa salina TaxID=215803 RepID=A0A2S9XXL5_9BACT|nr:alpha/beta fold hydrolase [Enhygromyxa salina]PRP97470.1 Alpha/beta hydrolase family protein [Enhygromyxa salina]
MTLLRPLIADVDAELREVPLVADDGVALGLTRFRRGPSDRSVLLVHGLTTSTDMFVMPEHDNLVESLLDAGWGDVWSVDWRGSFRLPYNTDARGFNVDDVALYDLPAALAAVRRHNGGRPVAVIAHCVGALALSMTIAAKLAGPLAGVVANSTFLTPNLSEQSRLKLSLLPAVLDRILPEGYIPMDLAQVGLLSRRGALFALAAAGSSCKDPTCQMISFAWGSTLGVGADAGGSALYEHRNLHPATHARLRELFGPAPLSFYPHLRKMASERAVVRCDVADARYDRLPRSALDTLDDWDTPLLFVNGVLNRVWTGSLALCHGYLADRHPDIDVTLIEIPGYGHQDIFIGRAAALDVFPRMISWLDERAPGRP